VIALPKALVLVAARLRSSRSSNKPLHSHQLTRRSVCLFALKFMLWFAQWTHDFGLSLMRQLLMFIGFPITVFASIAFVIDFANVQLGTGSLLSTLLFFFAASPFSLHRLWFRFLRSLDLVVTYICRCWFIFSQPVVWEQFRCRCDLRRVDARFRLVAPRHPHSPPLELAH